MVFTSLFKIMSTTNIKFRTKLTKNKGWIPLGSVMYMIDTVWYKGQPRYVQPFFRLISKTQQEEYKTAKEEKQREEEEKKKREEEEKKQRRDKEEKDRQEKNEKRKMKACGCKD